MNIKRKPAPPARTFYLASLTPAGSMQGTTEEIVLSEGAAAMVIAWTATSGAPRVQIFGDSWLGMRRWQDIFWEMGNLAREEAFSPADLRTMLIDRQCIESVDMYLQTESVPHSSRPQDRP